jgi:HEAT repeat protein
LNDDIHHAIAALIDGDRAARETAAELLKASGRWPLHLVRPVLAHAHVSRRIKALEVLRAHPGVVAVELALPLVDDSHYLVRFRAAQTLAIVGVASRELIASRFVAGNARLVYVLARLRDPRAIPEIVSWLDDPAMGPRQSAMRELRRFGARAPTDALRRGLRDPREEVRREACRAIRAVRRDELVPDVVDAWVNGGLLEALFSMPALATSIVEPLLERAAAGGNLERIRDALRWALFDPRLRATFWTLWARPEAIVRDACLAFLGVGYARILNRASRLAAVGEHISDPDSSRRRNVADALTILAQEGAEPELAVWIERLRADQDSSVRTCANSAHVELTRRTWTAPRT